MLFLIWNPETLGICPCGNCICDCSKNLRFLLWMTHILWCFVCDQQDMRALCSLLIWEERGSQGGQASKTWTPTLMRNNGGRGSLWLSVIVAIGLGETGHAQEMQRLSVLESGSARHVRGGLTLAGEWRWCPCLSAKPQILTADGNWRG